MGTTSEAFGWFDTEDGEMRTTCQDFWHCLCRIPSLSKEWFAFLALPGVVAGNKFNS
jgi:hypothetical protein